MGLDKRELDSLQYLGGYVVKKIIRKIKNSANYKSTQSQGILKILKCMTISDFQEQRPIKTISRGGLTALNSDGQSMFRVAEEHFRKETVDYYRKIDTQTMTKNLVKDVDMPGYYNNILGRDGIKIDNETKINLLEKLISLYFRVRAFSKARDITNKHIVEKKKTKSKGLRKDIKRAEEQNSSR